VIIELLANLNKQTNVSRQHTNQQCALPTNNRAELFVRKTELASRPERANGGAPPR